jgi:beta-lactamase regulating signal transducer with metallopeptidase domain
MNMSGITDHPLMQALGLAVLHSVWQGILFFCVLKMVLSLVSERRAALRYRILYVSLAGLAGLFCYTFVSEWQYAAAAWKCSGYLSGQATPVDAVASSAWQDSLFISYVNAFRRYTTVLALLYTAGLLVLCFKMLRELLQVRYLRRQVMLPDTLLEQRFLALKEQAGIRKPVLLRLSEKVQVPLMLGHLKPVVLLPISLMSRLDMQQVEAVLMHELAHIKRHDYFWNILQMVMETLLFFNPVAWWLSALIREEREHCCDDYVLRRTQKSLPYAHALLALEEYRISRYAATVALSGTQKNSLLNRIKRITAMKQNKGNTQRILATVTVLVLLAAMACFATAFGQDKKEASRARSKSYSKKVVTVTDDKGNTKVYKDETGDPSVMEETMKIIPDAMALAGDAMKEVDWDEISKTVEGTMAHADKAMQAVDWDEIQNSVNLAMKSVDWDEIQNTVDNALQSAQASMDKEGREEMKKAMAEAREEIAKARIQMREDMKNVDWDEVRSDMKKAREEMKKAMKESKEEMKQSMKASKADGRSSKEDMKKAAEDEYRNAGEESKSDTRID